MKSPFGSSLSLFDRFLGLIEHTRGSDRFLLRIAFFAIIATGIWSLILYSQQYAELSPTRGGSFAEGIVGVPRFVNPVLASTRADQDVTSLVYSGLMRIDTNGELINDVAESINTSDDGLTYNIVLRKDITFHDGSPLTARDVAYTVRLIQDPDLKSPLRGNWTNVMIEEIGEYELNIVLEEAYAPFIENFTTGIMPAHLWSNLSATELSFSQLNTEPVGSGPFMIAAAKRDTSGLINHYTLRAYRENNADPKIDSIELFFYPKEEQLLIALQEGDLDSTAYISNENLSEVITGGRTLIEEPLPRIFGIFFNQNRSAALRDLAAREALTAAIDRDVLIETALYGYGVPIERPTALGTTTLESTDGNEDTATT
ncbi:ABC transporter substrate-binding protein, partial [Candidatus Kaiserbacteria bacterium]|nr:ABC transporter substrate-binding protein [Candidatus Kaiserbacteria bacterium]